MLPSTYLAHVPRTPLGLARDPQHPASGPPDLQISQVLVGLGGTIPPAGSQWVRQRFFNGVAALPRPTADGSLAEIVWAYSRACKDHALLGSVEDTVNQPSVQVNEGSALSMCLLHAERPGSVGPQRLALLQGALAAPTFDAAQRARRWCGVNATTPAPPEPPFRIMANDYAQWIDALRDHHFQSVDTSVYRRHDGLMGQTSTSEHSDVLATVQAAQMNSLPPDARDELAERLGRRLQELDPSRDRSAAAVGAVAIAVLLSDEPIPLPPL